MRNILLLALILTTAANGVLAASPIDLIGGPDGDTQTMHHCGFLPTLHAVYTDSALDTRIVQQKLSGLGYYRGAIDGRNGRATKSAVRAFQTDYALKSDGVVGGETVSRLAFASAASPHVRGCWRNA